MCKRIIFSALVILLLVGANAIASNDWLVAGTSSNWFDAANWDDGVVPSLTVLTNTRLHQTHMNPTYMPIINSGENAESHQLEIGGDNDVWDGVTVTDATKTRASITLLSGGTITTNDYFRVGASSSSNRWGEFFMNDGALVTVGSYMAVARGNTTTNTHGFVWMTGGTIDVAGDLYVAHGIASSGLIDISGGTINVGGLLSMRPNGSSTVYAGDHAPTTVLDITGSGKVVLAGNQTLAVEGYIANGWILSNGEEFLEEWVIYNPTANTTTLVIPEPATICLFGLGAMGLIRRRK